MSTGVFFSARSRREHFPAIEARQHHIQQDGVVVLLARLEQAVLAIAGRVHGIVLLAQRRGQAAEEQRDHLR